MTSRAATFSESEIVNDLNSTNFPSLPKIAIIPADALGKYLLVGIKSGVTNIAIGTPRLAISSIHSLGHSFG